MHEPSTTRTIYSPEPFLKSPRVLLGSMWADLMASHELAMRFAIRDTQAQYRQAALGFLWAFLLPLINTTTWILLNYSGVISVEETAIPYPVFVFTGTLLWAIFLEAVNAPLSLAVAAKMTLAKVNFPKEALVLSGIYKTLFNGMIKIAVLFIALVLLGQPIGWTFFLFPLGMLSLIMIGTALGILVTPPGLLYSDVGKFIPVASQLMMYITPVVFAVPQSGFAKSLLELNPITPIIMTTRSWITSTSTEYFSSFVLVNIVMMLLLLVFWVVFRISLPAITERMYA